MSPAVAVRLQEVLRLSLRSLNTSRAISAARRSSLAVVAGATPRAGGRTSTGSEGGHTLRSLYATPRPSAVQEEPREGDDDADAPAKRVELLTAVSTQVDEPAAAAPAKVDDEEMAEAAPEADAAV